MDTDTQAQAALFAALAKAQAEIKNPEKSKTAKVPTKSGGSYTYKYADIADVLRGALPVLSKHGLALIQQTHVVDGQIILRSWITHEKGGWVESEFPICAASRPMQEIGAALTYARRYAACALIGVAAEEDVDGVGDVGDDRRQARAEPKAPPKREPEAPRLDPAKPVKVLVDDTDEAVRRWVGPFAAAIKVAPDLAALAAWMDLNAETVERLRQVSDNLANRLEATRKAREELLAQTEEAPKEAAE